MLHFLKLAPTISVALLMLQQQMQPSGGGRALARPVRGEAGSEAFPVLATSPRSTGPAADKGNSANADPPAVLKALDAMSGSKPQTGQSATPYMAINHGEGGVIKPGQSSDDTVSKSSTQSGASKQNGAQSPQTHSQGGKSSDAAKAAMKTLQQPRTRFCAQAANTNRTVDAISQNLVSAERKRLAKIRKQRQAKSTVHNATDARSLTDAKLLAEQSKTVDVVWHVIHSGSSGNLSDAMIADQIQTLNEDYKAYGFAFELNTTNRVENASWYRNIMPDGSLQDQMKAQLRKGDAKTLNLYSVDFNNGLLGYSSFPWNIEDLTNDGVVFQYSTVPGGSETGYNLGKTATHEVGHWLGLYHVFQGGCVAPGDYVDDTPPQSLATSGCPAGQDSCSGGGPDSIHK